MESNELMAGIHAADPAVGPRAVDALHRLAERVEAIHVRLTCEQGWSREQIGVRWASLAGRCTRNS